MKDILLQKIEEGRERLSSLIEKGDRKMSSQQRKIQRFTRKIKKLEKERLDLLSELADTLELNLETMDELQKVGVLKSLI